MQKSKHTESKNQELEAREKSEGIEISSSSEEDPKEIPDGFYHFGTNSLSKNRMNETLRLGLNSDRKNRNLKNMDVRRVLRESQSIGVKQAFDDEEDEKDKDSMVVEKERKKMNAWETNHDWHNQSLEPGQEIDAKSKVTKKSKNSKIGSRDGSRRAKRKIKALASLQKNRDKINVSRQGKQKIVKNKNTPINFDEFKCEDKFNKVIGANEEELDKIQSQEFDFDPNEIVVDESRMDDESFNFNPDDRSLSWAHDSLNQENEFVQDNPIEIVEQNSFDKLENYKDRLPWLHLRKSILRLRRAINKIALLVITNPTFEYGSLWVIIANCISLSMYDPLNPSASSTGFLGNLDTVFLACYSFEMVMKIIGLGFVFNKGAYLRDNWNILDFIIVMSAYLQLMISSGANLSVLRSFRVLRPLRTISGIEGLKVIVTALLKAVSLFLDTAIILLFFFIIFAIAGLQLFGGVLRQKCVSIDTGQVLQSIDVCGTVGCPAGYNWAKTLTNPNYGVSNFDNIFYSLLMAYQSVTLEGWTYNMIFVEKALGWMTYLYFLPLVCIGAFFLINLTLVVIASKFSEEHEANKQKKKMQKYILQRQANKVDKVKEKEAKKALNRIKVKNKKVYMTKIERKDSDDSLAQKKHFRTIDKQKREEIIDKINADLPPYSCYS